MVTTTAVFVDKASVALRFWVDSDLRAQYTQVEVWRSTLGEGGPYKELTGEAWGPAKLLGVRVPGALVGKSLNARVNETNVTVSFTGTDPLTQYEVVTQLIEQGAGLLFAMDMGGSTALHTTDVGCRARLEIVGGDAAPILGFDLGTAYGTDARLRLVDTNVYAFSDTWAEKGHFYKWRVRHGSTGAVSEFSAPITGAPSRAVDPDELVLGILRLVDIQGRPVANRTVLVRADTTAPIVRGTYLVDANDERLVTDAQGYCSMLLLRGVPLTVAIAGTRIVRDVTPPTDPAVTEFGLLSAEYGKDDVFSVQVPVLNLAERRECP